MQMNRSELTIAYKMYFFRIGISLSAKASVKKADLYEALRSRILRMELAPGSALEEATLSAEFGVSRTPLREVLHRLASEGFAKLETNRGATVSSMDMPVMRSFFQTAPMIYAAVARLAAENGKPEQIASLRESQALFREAVSAERARDMAIFNHRFHETIGEMAGNPYLAPSLKRLLIDHARMSQTFYDARAAVDRKRIATACDQHDAMIDAFEAREPARAVELTLDHWALSRDRIERFVQPDPLPLDPETEMRDAV